MSRWRAWHPKRQALSSPFLSPLSDSTLSANRPVASAFIGGVKLFFFRASLLPLTRRDLSARLCVGPPLCEIRRDSDCRGFKPRFVTPLTQERNMDFDCRLFRQTLRRIFVQLRGSTAAIYSLYARFEKHVRHRCCCCCCMVSINNANIERKRA